MLLELTPEQVEVGGFTGEAVPILSENHRDATSGDQVPHPIQPRSLQACAALSGVLDLLEDLVALSRAPFPQGLDLLPEAKPSLGLAAGAYPRVQDGPLRHALSSLPSPSKSAASAGRPSRFSMSPGSWPQGFRFKMSVDIKSEPMLQYFIPSQT